MQADKRDKSINAQINVMADEGEEDTQNPHVVENRRQQFQGYLDQKDDREAEHNHIYQNKQCKQTYNVDSIGS
eukprot:2068977-Heterocapsa_arctica.AAC.1